MAPIEDVYKQNERVLCFHGELLYEAKILDSRLTDATDKKSQRIYLVHYKGWKNTWDDWVLPDRIRKDTEENKELARSLKRDSDASRRTTTAKAVPAKKRGDEGFANSEEKTTGRGKRARDNEIETDQPGHSEKTKSYCPKHRDGCTRVAKGDGLCIKCIEIASKGRSIVSVTKMLGEFQPGELLPTPDSELAKKWTPKVPKPKEFEEGHESVEPASLPRKM